MIAYTTYQTVLFMISAVFACLFFVAIIRYIKK